MKKIIPLISSLVFVFIFGFSACSSSQTAPIKDDVVKAKDMKAPSQMKIGILTGTVSQGEDEYRAAQQIMKKYPGRVLHMTYPDNFMQEQETTISNIVSMSSDPTVKAIIIGQAVPGAIAGVRKVKRMRPDILFVFWEAHEDPHQADKAADLLFNNDNISRGRTIPELAKKMGATRILHYSFPRHMSYKLLADRRDKMKIESAKLGLEFIFVTAPDPLGEGGIPAAQQFMLEDVPRQIKKYGKDTAFFCTNDAMTEPLIKRVAEGGAIFLEPDMPSPTMGFPGALGIKIPPDKAGDFHFINQQIKDAVAKLGNTGRMASWPVPSSMVSIKASADLLFDTNANKAKLGDRNLLEQYLTKQAGVDVKLSSYEGTNNYHLVLMENIIY